MSRNYGKRKFRRPLVRVVPERNGTFALIVGTACIRSGAVTQVWGNQKKWCFRGYSLNDARYYADRIAREHRAHLHRLSETETPVIQEAYQPRPRRRVSAFHS